MSGHSLSLQAAGDMPELELTTIHSLCPCDESSLQTFKPIASLQHEFLQAISPMFYDLENLSKATILQSSFGRVDDHLKQNITSPDARDGPRIEVKTVYPATYFATSRYLGVLHWTFNDTFSVSERRRGDRTILRLSRCHLEDVFQFSPLSLITSPLPSSLPVVADRKQLEQGQIRCRAHRQTIR